MAESRPKDAVTRKARINASSLREFKVVVIETFRFEAFSRHSLKAKVAGAHFIGFLSPLDIPFVIEVR